jgi:hypothetical protein
MHSMDTGSREQESKGNPWEATEPLFATDNDLERPDVLL